MSQIPDQPIASTTDRELILTRVFAAPRSLVYDAWTTQEHAGQWFVPRNAKLLESHAEVRVGGAWSMAMHIASGDLYRAGGVYTEIVPGERLVFTHAWEGDDGKPEHWTLITVDFADHAGGKTLLTFKQAAFRSVESRNNHEQGWSECLDHLAEYLARITASA